jgi:hypothetical protein
MLHSIPPAGQELAVKEKCYPSLWALAVVLVSILALHNIFFPRGLEFYPVDGRVYAVAIDKWLVGADPYSQSETLTYNYMRYNYPPAFVLAGGELARVLNPHAGWIVYLTFHFAAVLVLPWILYKFYLRKTNCTLPGFYFLVFLGPGLLGFLAMETANVAVICYGAMVLASSLGLTRNRWLPFYIVVFLACSIKITYLPMLLLPLFCGRKQWLGILACGAASVAGLVSQRWLAPALFNEFVRNLSYHTAEAGDVGKGVFGILFHVLHKSHMQYALIPFAGYGVVALAVVATLTALWRRGYADRFASWPALVVTGVLLSIPRVEYYDLFIGLPLIFTMFVSEMRIRRAYAIYALYVCLFIPSIVFLERSTDTALNGGYETLIILVMFFCTCNALIRSSTQPRVKVPDAATLSG